MRKIGFGLLLFIGLLFSYLIWNYVTGQTSNTKIVPPYQKENSKEIFFDSGKKKIDEAKSFIEQIPEAAGRVLGDLIDRTKDIAGEKISAILGTPTLPKAGAPAVNVGPTSSPASPNAANGNNPVQNSSAEFQVCSVVSKGTLVDYSIDQPFPNAEETSYKIIWGDKETVGGLFRSGDRRIAVSHTYQQQGTYSITFQLTNGSTILTVSRSICVK
ncbi:MAG: PKD domain-containing protein [Candidatus Liptonbacteria bacterium]|nr:PKD domain-containing protein [Candidatus Liptonbacteria bacterium]